MHFYTLAVQQLATLCCTQALKYGDMRFYTRPHHIQRRGQSQIGFGYQPITKQVLVSTALLWAFGE